MRAVMGFVVRGRVFQGGLGVVLDKDQEHWYHIGEGPGRAKSR